MPLRDRNTLLLAGGFAPRYPEHGLDEPELVAVRAGLRRIRTGTTLIRLVLVNRWWELVDQNASVSTFTDGVALLLLEPPVNVLRLSLHPDGMAPRIANLAAVARPPAYPAAPPGGGHRPTPGWPPCTRSCAAIPEARASRRRSPTSSCRCATGATAVSCRSSA